MGEMILNYKLMGESPDTIFDEVLVKINSMLKEYNSEVGKSEVSEVAFGLKALSVYFILDESVGNTSEIEDKLADIDGVAGVEMLDMRRVMG